MTNYSISNTQFKKLCFRVSRTPGEHQLGKFSALAGVVLSVMCSISLMLGN